MPRHSLSSLLGLSPDPESRASSWLQHERHGLLPQFQQNLPSAFDPVHVTKTALRIRFLIAECVPCELDETLITRPHSTVITAKVVAAARDAGGPEYAACVVFCLLVCKQWFQRQSMAELWDADLHRLRATACEVVAKALIENEQDMGFLMHAVLLRRYAVVVDGQPTPAVNVIEKAVDLHALRVICSSGYQRCIAYLWRGWLVQDENDPSQFVEYSQRADVRFVAHLDPDRIRAPRYQNATQLAVSVAYLALYTAAINSINAGGALDAAELALYVFTLGYVMDELTKLWKAGWHILGFWNALNGSLYSLLLVSLGFRIVGLAHPEGTDGREHWATMSYNLLACSAPLFWTRLLLYLDGVRFFGAMLVVLKVMMKESLIFFALLAVVVIGFLQAFVGLDLADDLEADDVFFIVKAMANAVMGSPEYDGFDRFAPPFGLVLYYLFTFVVMVILLNILIALYGSAYSDIYENANDEFLALFAHKTMQFVRAPDENVYIPPFNLVELAVAAVTEWWMDKAAFERLNDCVMAVIYSPVLLVAAWVDTRAARSITLNRLRGEDDDDVVEEWEQMGDSMDMEADGWAKTVQEARSNVEEEPAVQEVKKLAAEVAELRAMVAEVKELVANN
ncbi:hypothetical protein TD95_005429 [Thielaviopsis punctulata]|uniref:Ion transport domain-containing protein n=1 Tax=Thielaviopsis punctulata TaxID=72032 RepID=A0A0F4ZED6_9PEZI|nr:hypothetical protein TD95_005429 [Thielaviopsis punctulata]